ncbi:hypothetical protein [Hafnia alvei]|uniref:hypothetical protein n=1 Tax=Hafnia alvei TaxID=569 RepID=UPI0006217E66|nr:hypothetical protein [Hafnia alvei]KKI44710.1 hypothetical protein XK86_11445 [Hafnia alvei]
MKNNYSFDLLEKKETYSGPDKNELFFCMLNLTKNSNSIALIESVCELGDWLSDDNYYIAHNIVFYKGKKAFFNGSMVIASKNNLINFIKKSMYLNELRDFLISPVFNGCPSYVIVVNDESFYLCT